MKFLKLVTSLSTSCLLCCVCTVCLKLSAILNNLLTTCNKLVLANLYKVVLVGNSDTDMCQQL